MFWWFSKLKWFGCLSKDDFERLDFSFPFVSAGITVVVWVLKPFDVCSEGAGCGTLVHLFDNEVFLPAELVEWWLPELSWKGRSMF